MQNEEVIDMRFNELTVQDEDPDSGSTSEDQKAGDSYELIRSE